MKIEEMSLAELEQLRKGIDERIRSLKFEKLPRVIVDDSAVDVRPRYLIGCTGRMGGWVSNKRRRFYPDAGTEAADRGPEWRVDASILRPVDGPR